MLYPLVGAFLSSHSHHFTNANSKLFDKMVQFGSIEKKKTPQNIMVTMVGHHPFSYKIIRKCPASSGQFT